MKRENEKEKREAILRNAALVRKAMVKHYSNIGPHGIQEHLKNVHGFQLSMPTIFNWAARLNLKYERGTVHGEEPLEGKLKDFIAQGALVKAKGDPIAELHELLHKEADTASIKPNFLQNRDNFKAKVMEIVWDKKALEALEKIVRRNMSLETFTKYHQNIPQKFVEAKAKELRGVSHAKDSVPFIKGFGRLSDLSKLDPKDVVRFEATSIDHPYDSGIRDERWKAGVLNGSNVGIDRKSVV